MRLIIISNRLPVTIEKREGKINFKESSGGLVSGLSSYLDSIKGSGLHDKINFIWVGWPGSNFDLKDTEQIKQTLFERHNAVPVFLSKDIVDNFYNGFCNNTIWPLFHYFPSYAIYKEEYWKCYEEVNELFCDNLLQIIKPGDIVWVHDYHLMLLPDLIRKKMPDIKIGFFLHIPFPTYEIFSLLPSQWRTKILEGLLGSDLIGFHTYDYTQYFLRCVLRILGTEPEFGEINYNNRTIKADTFPMGIDFNKFNKAVSNPEVQNLAFKLKVNANYDKVILSIDRLDYSKGIINRLEGYELFLEKNPEWIGKIILSLIIVPSRYNLKHYQKMKKQIDQFVGRLNGKYSNIHWSPISYQYQHLPFYSLIALYSISDIILVTPLRDGMNLISKEYLATRVEDTGVLILSEMAGSSKELGEAIIINPNNKEEIADAIYEASKMPVTEQKKRNAVMRHRLKRYDVVKWATDFIDNLLTGSARNNDLSDKYLSESKTEIMISHYNNSKSRLIFLDYDGTLVPFTSEPSMAKPNEKLLKILQEIACDNKNEIVIISGRKKDTLEEWFKDLPVSIVAEHGAWIKEKSLPDDKWKLLKNLDSSWKPKMLGILETYVDRLYGSFIEEKHYSLAWHYRKADPELASVRVKELIDQLLSLTSNLALQVLQGSKVVEIRNSEITKGLAGLHWFAKSDYDFILAIGDDITDEDLFKVLPDYAHSIKVRPGISCSRYFLRSYQDVVELLDQFVYKN